jgi:hypothetical protein
MAENAPLITAGEVIEVQLTSETVVIEGAETRFVEPGHITNRMRLFVREDDGREQKFDFDDTELGVRETQRVAVVRGRMKRVRDPFNLMLFNLSSDEHDTFESGLSLYLGRTPFLPPPWKALVLALGVALIFWIMNDLMRGGGGGGTAILLALVMGGITYPVFWWLCALWDRVGERIRYRHARKRFIADMTGRVRAYARRPASQPQPAPTAAEPSGA